MAASSTPTGGDPPRPGDGIRIDAFYELVAHHKLGSFIPNAPEPGIVLDGAGDRAEAEASWLPAVRKAVRLLKEATSLSETEDVKAAVEKCNDALATLPNHGTAYLLRGNLYLACCIIEWDKLRPEDRCKYAMRAEKDLARGRASLGEERTDLTFEHDLAKVYMGMAFHERSDFEQAVAGTTRDLAIPGLSGLDKACLLDCRAQARNHPGDRAGSRRDVDEARKISPDGVVWEPGDGPS